MNGIFDSNTPAVAAVKATGTNGAKAVKASTDTGTAVEGICPRGTGVLGGTSNGIAVAATCTGTGIGVRATANDGWAINAQNRNGVGILGASDYNTRVHGECLSGYGFGVVGRGANAGVVAFNPNNNHAAYLASNCCAAWFTGNVTVTGKLLKGGGGFRIDHPLEPEKKFLSHSFVESPEMKNVYDGVVLANKKGEAVVSLPKWFQSLNSDFRYQLTPIGGAAPNLHVAEEITGNRFRIAGAKAGMKISWQVTGIRCDAWANANRINVEEVKRGNEQNHFLHPELYGADQKSSIATLRHPNSRIKVKKKR